MTYSEIYLSIKANESDQKKPNRKQDPKEPGPSKEPSPKPECSKHQTKVSISFNRIREIKKFETQLNQAIKSSRSADKETTKSILQKDYPVRKPSVIDCEICSECLQIKRDIGNIKKRNRQFKVKKIINMYAQASYALRKKEYVLMYGKDKVKEALVYHGTNIGYVNSIVKNNFNWRLYGKNHGCIFGKGTSFANNLEIAEIYCDQRANAKCIIVARVLAANACLGNSRTVFPKNINAKKRFDTTMSPRKNDKVLVKYRDDEFLPTHIIYFTDVDKDKFDFHYEIEYEGRDFVS